MTNRFWHLANPDGTGTGNVIRLNKGEFVISSSIPVTHHCDPSNPAGWIEGEEVYQVYTGGKWFDIGKSIYEIQTQLKRIWIEPKREQPEEKPFHIDMVREMLNQYETEQISISKLTELLNQAAEKFYKS